MNKNIISCQVNDLSEAPGAALFDFAHQETVRHVYQFHCSLPGYRPSPLVRLPGLAGYLGINQLFVKDENYRFDLKAFKVLGASYAMAKCLGEVIGLKDDELTYHNIIAHKLAYDHLTFVTATDGNHGRAVAWAAKLFGCKAVVYLPKGSSPIRLEAIKKYGAQASITGMNFDDSVMHASRKAQEKGWTLLQDTSWEGYEKVPLHIMQGYSTLITESIGQGKENLPTHVFVQAGVGSFAAAMVASLVSLAGGDAPTFIVVEPEGAPCLFESIKKGGRVRIKGGLDTIMAGLSCGEPSLMGWQILKSAASAFLMCSDEVARRGMKVLGNPLAEDPCIISGESGAVTLGALFEIMSDKENMKIRQDIGLVSDSRVLLFSTEGDTDPGVYRDIVWG
ncbi:MAG: diaminopropionate ammonia-lyase [Desulfotignum sp.]|nr:diaminopropionate ammonia-lyase [Desulfotignum sp.]MCF8125330.1 diaminopropionate ammonia-lyase [Desulfotignum sp.]